MSAVAKRPLLRGRWPLRGLRPAGLPSGIGAIVVKELRGRMRGRRAFIIITVYILLLAGFASMFQRQAEELVKGYASFGGQATYASATVGRAVFSGLLMVQTLMVVVLAPAATAAAISSEREHQTLDMLAVTPISSIAIVFGKLLSALAWVFVLILASVPVTALVFVFGGVAPDDVVRGYAVLFATTIAFGAIGIFFSALTRRTSASTSLTLVVTLALVAGTFYGYRFLAETAPVGSTGLRRQPPEAILYLNPFVAQSDVACGTEEGSFGTNCELMAQIIRTDPVLVPPDVVPTRPVPMPGIDLPAGVPQQGGVFFPEDPVIVKGGVAEGEEALGLGVGGQVTSFRDRLWPKSVLSFLALAAILTILSIQFVTPTRRWRPSLPGPVRRLIRRRSAP